MQTNLESIMNALNEKGALSSKELIKLFGDLAEKKNYSISDCQIHILLYLLDTDSKGSSYIR